MKVLITMYGINSPGGIINHNENLIAGLKMCGHEVDFVELLWRNTTKGKTTKHKDNYERGASGIPVHQGKGWLFPKEKRIPYKGKQNINKWKEFANKFDVIIWQIPVPTKQRDNTGNMDWTELYNLNESVKQVAVIHDGNMRKSYPWISYISKHLNGLACVHPCGYHGASVLNTPRALILNPQNVDKALFGKEEKSWTERKKGFISLQTFKGWKHVDDLVRAIPHMNLETAKVMAGGGIEHNYMTSENKCKPNYFVSEEKDPDILSSFHGHKIWDVAMQHKMEWLGYICQQEAKQIMGGLRCLIDPSWSVAYAKIGDHFNRVLVDGIIEGLIPIARNFGVSTNEEGIGEVFKPNTNYIMVPHDATPKEFAETVEYTLNLSEENAGFIRHKNKELLKHFERERVASDYVNLAFGLPTGFYNKLETGVISEQVKEKTELAINTFFNAQQGTQ
tara:strand:- start:7204 stop:8553 length:1350 start_codon:yes stop_codon:yes gene_type:complete